MRIDRTVTFPVTPDRVYDAITSEQVQDTKCRRTYALSWTVDVQRTEHGAVITTSRTMPTDDLPEVARGFVGERLSINETQTWGDSRPSGSRDAELVIHIGGTPMTLTGTITLVPDGQGTTMTVAADLSARVPLIGGKIERAAAPVITAAIEIESETIADAVGGLS